MFGRTIRFLCAAGLIAAVLGVSSPCRAGDEGLLCDVAVRSRRPAEAPPLAAVCFSSRWIHPRTPQDPWNTFQAAAAFHATDFLWVYSLDRQAVQRLKRSGGKVYLAINSRQPDEPDKTERLRGRILDLEGNRVTAPWMRSGKGNFWGCANSPEYREIYVAYAAKAVDAGADGLQMDDPLMNAAAVKWGGCFCPHCLAGFRRWLTTHASPADLAKAGINDLQQFNYRDYLKARHAPVGDEFAKYDGGPLKRLFVAFQEESVRDFFHDVRARIDAHAGRHIPFSSNNYAGNWQFPYDLFEIGTAELPKRDANAKTLYQRFADARRHGKAQVFTVVPTATDDSEVASMRRAVAMCYACGGHLLVPWDVYTLSDRPRYFGKPEQYADLYKFVRDHRQLFDGYEDAAFALQGLTDDRYSTHPPISLTNADGVAAIARALPGKPEAPLVIHLVDWRATPQPMTATLLTRRFVRHGSLQAELLRPGSPAMRLVCHTTDTQTSIEIPRLDPWGIVVVTPAGSREQGAGSRESAVPPGSSLPAPRSLPAVVTSPEEAAGRLLERLLPGRSQQFVFRTIPPQSGHDVFELESRDGELIVRGNSALSMAFGLNWYLKYYGHCNVSINGSQLNLPSPLPRVERKFRLASWAKSRYLLNYCTFGYVSPWWDWPQWEQCIDWMALNGVNQPLAVTGQEGVWQAVCRKLGMTDAEIEAFLPGPPYLPFCWMGCLDGFGGPLPKDWITRHVELGQKIVARERELGMTPVLQGFTGHIPQALIKKFPGTKTQRIKWCEFDTCMLDPRDPLFQKVATLFIEEQTRLFGSDHLYDSDSFIEMCPPRGDLPYVAGIGSAVYEGMAKADPKAVWLLQGWTFMNQAQFWTPDRIRAFLNAVPNDKMLVLDLFCERTPVWNTTQGFYGKPWVWSFVYTFGDDTILGGSGPLERLNDLAAVRRHPLGQEVRGVGMMMEGYGHNPLVYDLMFEMGWRDDLDLAAWMREYPRFRYGRKSADAESAWQVLRGEIYNRKTWGHSLLTSYPAAKKRAYIKYPEAALAKAWQLLLRAGWSGERGAGSGESDSLLPAHCSLLSTETYRHDLVNIARQALSNHAAQLYAKTREAYDAKNLAAYRTSSQEFLRLIYDLDELLATDNEFLLGPWLEDAKRWGQTDAGRARLEWNARRVLTLWGTGRTPPLRDYAWKEWSGMLSGFYAKRWELFFRRQLEALEANRPFDEKACNEELLELEDHWAGQTERYPTQPAGQSAQIAGRLFDKYMRAK